MIYEITTTPLKERIVFGIIMLVLIVIAFLLLRKLYRKVMYDVDREANPFSKIY